MLTAFIIGLMGSAHCLGMCGPLVLAVPGLRQKDHRIFNLSLYHTGRIAAYASLGLIMGIIGYGLSLFVLQQWISIITGVLILLFYFVPKLFKTNPFPSIGVHWNRLIVQRMRRYMTDPDTSRPSYRLFGMGFLNGLLPCGLVYIALLGAVSTYQPSFAALYMALFGIGTWPLMVAVSASGGWAFGKYRVAMQRIIPIFVVMVAVLLIVRGLGLGIPYISPSHTAECCSHMPVL